MQIKGAQPEKLIATVGIDRVRILSVQARPRRVEHVAEQYYGVQSRRLALTGERPRSLPEQVVDSLRWIVIWHPLRIALL